MSEFVNEHHHCKIKNSLRLIQHEKNDRTYVYRLVL